MYMYTNVHELCPQIYVIVLSHMYMHYPLTSYVHDIFSHLEHWWFPESVIDQVVSQHPDVLTKGFYGVS